ncbi:hypothetical protein [Jeotgalibacillus sp. R-1-5s-1]|uniref:hypothetical protein n=1 Tax=Jeotgalibacillus sp. R-1-5s-1 TaxID=2555897 RepID=UPI0010699C77|nr:hypothetical protein [Jeotgalibacillus sp. R-1-5s-1]TFD94514.1 hypothetical protein E2491_13880 [Jeotgalibacillus sp. R-1-5s-1]
MVNIFWGLLLIFFNPNLNFLDLGVIDYLCNILGYALIWSGIRVMEKQYTGASKIQPYVLFMIIHSAVFFLLSVFGYSPVHLPLNTDWAIITVVGLALMITGMFMVFVIISMLIKVVEEDENSSVSVRKLKTICAGLMLIFTLVAVSYFLFQAVPGVSVTLTAVLLILKGAFLFQFYRGFVREWKVVGL